MKLVIEYDGSRQLKIRDGIPDADGRDAVILVLASSDTGSLAPKPGDKKSKTWNFLNAEGKRVRVQIQEFG